MNFTKRDIFFFVLLSVFGLKGQSQNTLLAPLAIPGSYMDVMEFINPSSIKENFRYSANVNRSSFSGIRKVFHTNFYSFNFNTLQDNAFTFQVTSEKKGQWINNTTLLGGYVTRVQLQKDLSLVGGVNLGFHQSGVSPNPSGYGESTIKQNLRLGVSLLGKKITTGIALNDFGSINRDGVLPISVNTHFEYRTKLKALFSFRIGGLVRIVQQSNNLFYSFFRIGYRELIEVGVSSTDADFLIGLIQVNALKVGEGELSVVFGYETPLKLHVNLPPSSKYILGLKYVVFKASNKKQSHRKNGLHKTSRRP